MTNSLIGKMVKVEMKYMTVAGIVKDQKGSQVYIARFGNGEVAKFHVDEIQFLDFKEGAHEFVQNAFEVVDGYDDELVVKGYGYTIHIYICDGYFDVCTTNLSRLEVTNEWGMTEYNEKATANERQIKTFRGLTNYVNKFAN